METISINSSAYRTMRGRIVAITSLTELENLYEVVLDDDETLDHDPGQFVTVSLFGVGEAPISICSSPTNYRSFELCIRRAGRLTGALHQLQVGAEIGIRGPFGVGFPIVPLEGSDLLIIAGGLGIAPLRSLINYVIDYRREFGKVDILFGCRDPESMLFSHELEQWRQRVDINFCCSVDHADPEWVGPVGVISALIPGVNLNPLKTYAIVCGPPVMYRCVIDELLGKGIPDRQIYLSLERQMKCGLGKCGHCQIEHLYCCQDGPVFRYDRISQVRGAI